MTPRDTPEQKAALRLAAVHAVRERNAAAGDEEARQYFGRADYIEAAYIERALRDAGLISHPDQDSSYWAARDRATTTLIAKVKRALDAAAEDGELVRLNTKQDGPLPRLDGSTFSYGNSVVYITPDLYARCQEARRNAQQRHADTVARLDDLLARAEALGLPEPGRVRREPRAVNVTYGVEALAAIIERLETA